VEEGDRAGDDVGGRGAGNRVERLVRDSDEERWEARDVGRRFGNAVGSAGTFNRGSRSVVRRGGVRLRVGGGGDRGWRCLGREGRARDGVRSRKVETGSIGG
jgi:hypothetical protein